MASIAQPPGVFGGNSQSNESPRGAVGSMGRAAETVVPKTDYSLFALVNAPQFPTAKQFSLVDSTGTTRYLTLRFRPSTREQCWYLDLDDDASGERLLSSVRLVPLYDLLRQYRHDERLPAEVFFVASRHDRTGATPGLNDLGETAFLYHLRKHTGEAW